MSLGKRIYLYICMSVYLNTCIYIWKQLYVLRTNVIFCKFFILLNFTAHLTLPSSATRATPHMYKYKSIYMYLFKLPHTGNYQVRTSLFYNLDTRLT